MNFYDIPRLVEVKPQPNMMLKAKFENGKIKLFDMKPYYKQYEYFQKLKNEKLFNKVKAGIGGLGVIWNKDIDLHGGDVYELGVDVNE
jgi:hypothetical protein